jgi:hypothetical protein
MEGKRCHAAFVLFCRAVSKESPYKRVFETTQPQIFMLTFPIVISERRPAAFTFLSKNNIDLDS